MCTSRSSTSLIHDPAACLSDAVIQPVEPECVTACHSETMPILPPRCANYLWHIYLVRCPLFSSSVVAEFPVITGKLKSETEILVEIGYKCSFRITKALQRLLLQKEWRISHQLGIGWASDEKMKKSSLAGNLGIYVLCLSCQE